jgi:4-hydroxy-tetrahydrodipicolinate synthase
MPALVTPLDEGGEVDVDAFERLVADVRADGADGVVVAGTTGEGPLVPRGSIADLIGAAVGVLGGAPVVAGAWSLSVDDTHDEVARLVGAGATAVLVPPPFYFPLSPEAQVGFFAGVAGRADAPVLAYHIPQFTRSSLTAETMAQLPARGLAGMKDSSGDIDRLARACALLGEEDFAVYVGDEMQLVDGLVGGASGSITAIANLSMAVVVRLVAAFQAGDETTAASLQEQLRSSFEELTAATGLPMIGIKDELYRTGRIGSPRCLPPLQHR